jgi:hypothetical protein
MKKDDVGGKYSMHGEMKNAQRVLVKSLREKTTWKA